MRSRDNSHFVAAAPLVCDFSIVDRALQMVNGLAAIQQSVNLTSEFLDRDVVAQENHAQ